MAPIVTADIKHILDPSPINVKSNKSLVTSVPITWYIMCTFQQKITKHTKR